MKIVDTNIEKIKPIVFRLGKKDLMILVWRNALKMHFSTAIKSLLYASKNSTKFECTLGNIVVNEEVLKPKNVLVSFARTPLDLELYQYVNSDDFSPCTDSYLKNDLTTKIKKLILDSIDPETKELIQDAIYKFNSNKNSIEINNVMGDTLDDIDPIPTKEEQLSKNEHLESIHKEEKIVHQKDEKVNKSLKVNKKTKKINRPPIVKRNFREFNIDPNADILAINKDKN